LRVAVEIAVVRIGDAHLSLTTATAGAGATGDAASGEGAQGLAGMPEVHAEGSRFFLRGVAPEAELTAVEPGAKGAGEVRYRVEPPGRFDEGRRRGSGDGIEWTLRGRDGLERVLRVVHPGAARWRVSSLRDPTSGRNAGVEYDSSGHLGRIATDDGVEWRFEYERPSPSDRARLAQVSARTSVNAGGEMLYRARLDYGTGPSGATRLERVRAASRVPAGVTELALVWSTSGPEPGAGERLHRILTPRGEIEPRFEYSGDGATAVFSAVPTDDAYAARYPVTARLAPEFVGEDLLEDTLGRRTVALDEAARARHRLRVRGGRLLRADGTPLDTEGLPFLIVLAPDGELYAGRGDYSSDAKLHHSSFLAGAPVAAAGEIVVRAGEVLRVTARSGHYKPPMCLLDQLRAELERRGVEMDDVPFEKGY
jgi:hypothetical protein